LKRFLVYFSLYILLFINSAFALNFPSSEWSLASYEGAYATYNDGFISVISGGSDYWHVQLTRRNIELQMDKTYEVKFFLQGAGVRRNVEVRIGRDGFPYDAFAEFGEIIATVNGQMVTKTFKMQSGNVNNARFEFNLGKYSSSVFLSNISLNCLDCNTENQGGGSVEFPPEITSIDQDYVVIADTVDFRDNSMGLGNIFGSKLELGANSKIYGDVEVSGDCFLRERANINGNLFYAVPCREQNNVTAKTKNIASVLKPVVNIPNVSVGIIPVSVKLDESITLPPGKYGLFYANSRSKVRLSSGAYHFQSFYTEPDVEISIDLSSGPVSIGILNNVRFGDRNIFSIIGGNPSEISWNVVGNAVDLGTDGLYFGKINAPSAFVRIPSRTHLVGSVYARKFVMEPQSTVSQELRANEISHSEEHFGPFFNPGIFRYRSVLPLSITDLEMFVYADDAQVKVNGSSSKMVELVSSNTAVTVSLKRNQISGFPTEAFSANYVFNFEKNANYRIYWNPQTKCKQGCDGYTAETAIGDYATVLETANKTGREINMVGSVWNVTNNYKDGIVPWKVGFELVGNKSNLWDLTSENDLPLIDLGNTAHIKIEGRSPRSLTGLRIFNGYNVDNGGAINASNQKISLKNVLISSSKSNGNGGALFSTDTLNLENTRFSSNTAVGNAGAVMANGETKMLNVLFLNNSAKKNGGAMALKNAATYIGNAIFYGNQAGLAGGALFNENSALNMWNATLFANTATTANGAFGGTANGTIGNTIFWKNIVSGCNSGDCSSEVVAGYSATNSSFTNAYAGTNIYVGDPKFIDESKPAGENMYMSYDAGINLAEGSHLLKAGLVNENVPTADIVGSNRDAQNIPLGPYAWTLKEGGEFFVGILDDNGKVKVTKISVPLIDAISGNWYQKYLATSPYARVLKASIKKHSKTRIEKASVKLWVKDVKGNIRKDVQPISFEAYRNGEENGKYVFQTMTATKGKPIVFSRRPEDAGVFEHVIVICMKELSDYFYLEAK
jgi:predicted outer membrane repeat protein